MPVIEKNSKAGVSGLHQLLTRFHGKDPQVSIIVPAYNEERTLERLLASMAAQVTHYRMELLVVNNNSTDRTQDLLDEYGVRSVFVREQGVAHARQAGLEAARGKYIANADADTVYPPTWLEALIEPLENPAISCTYGTYSFIPGPKTSAFQLGLYERASRISAILRRRSRESTNVLGFNFAFRRADALAVGGFDVNAGHQGAANHESGPCEDGWMAECLAQKGRLYPVTSRKARARTSDRRLLQHGGLWQAFTVRLRREWKRLVIN